MNTTAEKKKYSPNGFAGVEMLLSLLLAFAIFLPWVRIEALGESMPYSLTDKPLGFIYVAIFLANFILKFFWRSRWLSLITAIVAILMYTELGIAMIIKEGSFSMVHYEPAVGEYVVLILGAALMLTASVSWMISLLRSAEISYRGKQYASLLFSCLRILFLCFVGSLLVGIVDAGTMDAFSAGEDNSRKMLVEGFFILVLITFVCWVIASLVRLLYRRINKDSGEEPVVAESLPIDTAVSSSGISEESKEKVKGKKPLIIGITAAVILLCGLAFFFFNGSRNGNDNNLLGVQKPHWERFVRITDDDAFLYEQPDPDSFILMILREDTGLERLVMRDMYDKTGVPRNCTLMLYSINTETVFPVLDETEDWYKVYIGVKEVREAFVMKSKVEEIKPEPITAELIDSVWTGNNSNARMIKEGEFANLVLDHVVNQIVENELVKVGVLTEGCLVFPNTSVFFPRQEDVAEVTMHDTSTNPEYRYWELAAPESYWAESDGYPVFNIDRLTDADLRQVVANLRPSKERVNEVWYYFPTLVSSFRSFEYSLSPVTTENEKEESGSCIINDYKIENDQLLAEVDGEYVETGFSDLLDIEIKCITDLDQDGSKECLIAGHPDGDMVLCHCMVVYNADTKEFCNFELTCVGEPKEEETDDGRVLAMRRGLRLIKYDIEDYVVIKLVDEMISYGTDYLSFDVDDVETDDRKVVVDDIDDDGIDDMICLWGVSGVDDNYIAIETINFGDGTNVNTAIEGQTIKILREKTSGKPDIIGDDCLFRWNGSSYELFNLDGTNSVE